MRAQSRLGSLAESLINIAIGFALQTAANYLVLPLFGFRPSVGDLLWIGLIMTAISVARSYVIRRWQEGRRLRDVPPDFLYIVEEIASERRRQIDGEGFTLAHDDALPDGDLAAAAAAYAYTGALYDNGRRGGLLGLFAPGQVGSDNPDVATLGRLWPNGLHTFKPTRPRRDLIKAAALIVAAIGKIDRKTRR